MSAKPADRSYVISVMSNDHPGIVASVTSSINDLGGNVSSCSQTVLHGYFTLIILADFPASVEPIELVKTIQEPHGTPTGFQVVVSPRDPVVDTHVDDTHDRFVVTAFGKDKRGIIMRFTQYFADKDINILDMYGEKKDDEFVLVTQVEVPKHWSVRMLQADLAEVGQEEGFTVRLQHENVFVATNELRLTHSQG